MGPVLRPRPSAAFMHRTCIALILATWLPAPGAAAEPRHDYDVIAGLEQVQANAALAPWTEAGASKLRYQDGSTAGSRVLVRYRGSLSETLSFRAAADFDGTDNGTFGLTEAELVWRPVPSTRTRHRIRAGAFYPPFSLENGDVAWTSPFGLSFSAINTWLAEEVRPIGLEWRGTRRVGDAGSRQEFGVFAAAFYGNDPAGTLLFWRGFSLHDRQTRLSERIALPPLGAVERKLDPIAETDGEPGYYAGVEWRVGRQALVQLARYDNRADPESFRDGQWGWDTRFWHVSAQFELPAKIGFVGQWMDGTTDWLTFTRADGQRTAATELVQDPFRSGFVLLTREFAGRHRISVRHDWFDMFREGALTIDRGTADAVSYQFTGAGRLSVVAEWLRIESTRDVWSLIYGLPDFAKEDQLRLRLQFDLNRRR